MAIHKNLKVQKLKLGEQEYEICDANALHEHQEIKQDGFTGATINRFGTCSAGASTAAKTVSITTGTFTLEAGAKVTIKFANANTASSPTLQVNNSAAKPIYHKGVQITDGANKALLAGVVDFVYDGDYWHLIGNYVGTVKYLGTVSSIGDLSTSAGQGDFYRVLVEFSLSNTPESEVAHVGDILIATKDNPTAVTDWDLIHTEVDSNTWVANTVDAAGFVEAPTAQNPNKVWKTDTNGNPGWREDIQYFSDTRPIVSDIGSIKAGETFETPISIQTLLARILYPFTELKLSGTTTAKTSGGATMDNNSEYTIPDCPILDEITLTVTPNSVTDFSFILYNSTDLINRIAEATYELPDPPDPQNPQVSVPLKSPIAGNLKVVFKNLGQTIDTTNRNYVIKYKHLQEDGKTYKEGTITVGPFNLKFTNPSTPTVKVIGTTPSGENLNASGTTTYKVGQSCTVSSVTALVTSLNSAKNNGIEKFILTRNSANGAADFTTREITGNNIKNKKSCTFSLGTGDVLAPTCANITSGSVSYTYTVEGKYDSRTPANATWEDQNSSVSNSAAVKFEFAPATVSLTLTGKSSQSNISKLDPINITSNSLKATFTKNSEKITGVTLTASSSVAAYAATESITNLSLKSGNTVALNSTTYSTETNEQTFSYARNNICSDLTLKAQTNGTCSTRTSNEIKFTFKAPFCWGWVGSGISLSSFNNYEDLKVLTTKKTTLSSAEYSNKTITIKTGSPTGQQKFVFACPKSENAPFSGFNGFTKVADAANFPCFDSFDGNTAADRLVDITFEDGSVVTYQIFVTSSVNGAGTTYKFS